MRSQVVTLQRLHLVISKIDHCTILQKRQFLSMKNTTAKSSAIWRLVKLIAAQFYKKDNFSDEEYDNSIQRLHLVSSKIDHCTVYKNDNFSQWRKTTTNSTNTCENLLFWHWFSCQKARLVQSISCFQQVLLAFYIGTHTDPTPVGSTEDSTCPSGKPSH